MTSSRDANSVVVPWRLSCVMDCRSSDWIWSISSTEKTNALLGGSRWRPTISCTFATKRLSLDGLKVLTRCGTLASAVYRETREIAADWSRSPIVKKNRARN